MTNFKQYLDECGIKHELKITHTPEENGTAERMNRTLLNLTRSMLHHRKIDLVFWGEAIATACYIRKRVKSRALPPNTTHINFGMELNRTSLTCEHLGLHAGTLYPRIK